MDEAFAFLAGVIQPYLPHYPAAAHGSLVVAPAQPGAFPHVGRPMEPGAIERKWEQLRTSPPDSIAIEAAIATFAITCAAASDDPRLQAARQILWDQKLRAVLPPPDAARSP